MKNLNTLTANHMANLNPMVVKYEVDASGISMGDISIRVLVNTNKGDKAMGFWIAFFEDGNGGLEYVWDQFFFDTNNEEDCVRKWLQENPDFCKMMTSAALDYIKDKGLFVDGEIKIQPKGIFI